MSGGWPRIANTPHPPTVLTRNPPLIPRLREGSKAPAHHPAPPSSTPPFPIPPPFRPLESPQKVLPNLGWDNAPRKGAGGLLALSPVEGSQERNGRRNPSWPRPAPYPEHPMPPQGPITVSSRGPARDLKRSSHHQLAVAPPKIIRHSGPRAGIHPENFPPTNTPPHPYCLLLKTPLSPPPNTPP